MGSLFGLTQASYSFELFKLHDLLSFKTILVYGIVLHNPVQQIVPWVPEVFSRAAGIFGVGRRPTHLRAANNGQQVAGHDDRPNIF